MATTFKELPGLISSGKRVFYVDGKDLHKISVITFNAFTNEHMLHVDGTPCGAVWDGQLFVGGEKVDLEDCVLVSQANTEDDEWWIQG